MQFGETALEVGTTVKLARALWIVPVTLFIASFAAERKPDEKRQFKLKVPWFIPGFLIAAALVTYLPMLFDNDSSVAEAIRAGGSLLKSISKYLMICTLFLIGANLSREKLRELGLRSLLHGVILWAILASVWCLAIYFKWVDCQ